MARVIGQRFDFLLRSSTCKRLQCARTFHYLSKNSRNVRKQYLKTAVVLNLRDAKPFNFSTSPSARSEADVPEQHKPNIPEMQYMDMVSFRKKQARCTVLIELAGKSDAIYAAKLCKDCGPVNTFLTYSCGTGSSFLLTEFVNEKSFRKFLNGCCFRNTSECFPVCSRLVRFEKKKNWKKAPTFLQNELDNIFNTKSEHPIHSTAVSQLMQKLYEEEKLTDIGIRLRFLFTIMLRDILSGMLPYCEVYPFGSSVNSFGASGCDLDVMLQMFPERSTAKTEFIFQAKMAEERILQQRAVNVLHEIVRYCMPGIYTSQKIVHARIPIVKLKHKILDLDCDISVNNMSAVYMSEVLYLYATLDNRVRPLVYSVKKWAKEAHITYSTPGSWITNFSLTLLVFFFLQNRPVPILPPLTKVIQMPGCIEGVYCPQIQYTQNPAKWRNAAKNNRETLDVLLKEFLTFLATFPFEDQLISLLTGKAVTRSDAHPLWIQYPFEDDKNVSRNVSKSEMLQMCRSAKLSASFLEKYVGQVAIDNTDLMAILGCNSVEDSQAIDVREFVVDSINNNAVEENVRAS